MQLAITRRISVLLTAFLALSTLLVGTASAQQYPPPPATGTTATVTVEKSGVAPGDIERITVEGTLPGSQVTIVLTCPTSCEGLTINGGGTVNGNTITFTGTSDGNGVIVFGIKIPRTAEEGTYQFSISGTDANGQPFNVQGNFVVDASLPITGGPISNGAALAGVAIVLGAIFLVVARGRDKSKQKHDVAS